MILHPGHMLKSFVQLFKIMDGFSLALLNLNVPERGDGSGDYQNTLKFIIVHQQVLNTIDVEHNIVMLFE